MENMTISGYFEEDHDRLDRLFKMFQKYKPVDFYRAKEYFVTFKFGLQRHIIWEEEILFPLFEKNTGMKGFGPTEVMRIEHRQIAGHLEALHKKVQMRDTDTEGEEKALLATLGSHNQKEENVLYPAIDHVATYEQTEAVFAAIKEIPEERYAFCCEGTVSSDKEAAC
jgi:regulator of cell morphogenesis and NO signaling